MYKLLIIIFFLIIPFCCFSQTNTCETSKTYKIIAIDSTENNYVIFASSNLWNTSSNVDIPFLSEKNECNYYSIYHYDNNNQYCIISPKISGLSKNISIGKNYNLSLNCITDKTLNEMNFHIGYGDYILQYPADNLYSAKEIVSLFYEQNIDSLNYYTKIENRKRLFDSKMFYIWMNLDKQSGICYSLWLNEQIKQIKPIHLRFETPLDSFMENQLTEKKLPVYDSLVKEYKVTRIKQIGNAYIIDLTDSEKYIYTIISLKEEKRRKPKIKKGKKYMFLLYSYYDPTIIYIGRDPIRKNLTIKGVTVSFITDRKTGAIVTTPNLEGLYYTNPNEMKNE